MAQTSLLANSHIVLAALDEGDSAIIVLRPDPAGLFRIIDTNTTFTSLLNCARERVLGATLSAFRGKSTDAAIQKQIDEAMSAGKTLRGEIEYVSHTKRPFWFGFTTLPIIDPATNRLHSVMLGRDITQKRKRDAEQSATQAMLASIFQKIDVPAVVMRLNGSLLVSNAAFQALLGYQVQEITDLSINQITAPQCVDTFMTAHKRQFADHLPYELEIDLVHKDGTNVSVVIRSVRVQRADTEGFRVVTVRPVEQSTAPVVMPPGADAQSGDIQFLSLAGIKEAYGRQWNSLEGRLLLNAEKILKRRLSPNDLCCRTANQGFSIWFKTGTKEENTANLTRIGREIQIALLGELGDARHPLACPVVDVAKLR